VAPREPAINPGDIVGGKYRVERVLGAGGMGVVVAATHIDLSELRAIKLLTAAARRQSGAVERFLREARASVRLKSEHVVRVHDVARFDSGDPYVVMEYLEGHDLAEEIERRVLPIDQAIDLVLQALEAIAEAHALGIVHRDLKPANLFITRDARGEPFVKILDFGISKLTGDAARGEGHDLTRTSTILGTPYYMSPEQMRSSKDVDSRADVWSIGVILYQLLTGTLPFNGTSLTELCMKVAQDTPATPGSLRAGVPDDLSAAIMRCLQKDCEARFADVAQLAAALAPHGGPHADAAAKRVADARGVCLIAPAEPSDDERPTRVAVSDPARPTTEASWQQGSIVLPMQGSRRVAIGVGVALACVAAAAIALWPRARNEDARAAASASAPPSNAPVAASATGASLSPSAASAAAPTAVSAVAATATSGASSDASAPPTANPVGAPAAKPRAPIDPFGSGRE
jgi:serine/threonine-protein kinase